MNAALVAVLAVIPAVTAGCAGSGRNTSASSTPVRSHSRDSGYSPIVLPVGRKALAGVGLRSLPRILSPTRLAIVTWGSGSCPAVDRVVVLSRHTLRIHLAMGSWRGKRPVVTEVGRNRGCTTDLRTTTMAVVIDPRQIDVHNHLTIRFYYYDSKTPIVRVAPPL